MSHHLRRSTLIAATGALLATTAHAAPMPSNEEMWEMIKKQQAEIESLKSELKKTDDKVMRTDQKVEATGEMVEAAVKKVGDPDAADSGHGHGGPGWWKRTSIGGYGEMHYNAMKSGGDDQVDFHRYVLFVGHEFNENIRLFSELELEHSLSGTGIGEVELEQAYIEFDIADYHRLKTGVFLLPTGILNETHEPTTFFGVERNPVENNIIPSTWWEGGLMLSGELGSGFSYDVAGHSGLKTPTTGSNAFKPRSGRQKVAQADADKGAVTSRIKWTGMPGVELSASGQYQQDVTQEDFTESVSATMVETHADILRDGFGLRALYARWDLDGNTPAALGRDEQYGWYVEPSYRFMTQLGEVGVFGRYNYYDNNAGNSANTDVEQFDVGVNYWPHPEVVLKTDLAFVDNAGVDDEILNLGVGFVF